MQIVPFRRIIFLSDYYTTFPRFCKGRRMQFHSPRRCNPQRGVL